jgi:hypothetical protein
VEQQPLAAQSEMLQAPSTSRLQVQAQRPPEFFAQEQQTLAAQNEMLQAPSASLLQAPAQQPPELFAQEQQSLVAQNKTHQVPSASLLQAPAQLPLEQPLEPHALNPRRETHQNPLPASVPAAVAA